MMASRTLLGFLTQDNFNSFFQLNVISVFTESAIIRFVFGKAIRKREKSFSSRTTFSPNLNIIRFSISYHYFVYKGNFKLFLVLFRGRRGNSLLKYHLFP